MGRSRPESCRVTRVLATAADAAYGYHALNLIGSVKSNSDLFERIEVFDLGLTEHQRELLSAVPNVELRSVPRFVPHWAKCFTWKPWAWTQVEAERVLWIDAGATVLRSLSFAVDQIEELGFFLVSQGGELRQIVPPDYFALYGLPEDVARRPYVCAGIIGFRPDSEFFERVIRPTYDDCVAGRNLGFSPGELASKNRGLTLMESPTLRDCAQFRWDQSMLNIHVMLAAGDAPIADLDEYGGWKSPHDHPRQVIWHHRRRAGLRYLTRIPYLERGWLRRSWGAWWRLRWRLELNRRFVQPRTYLLKARAMRRAVQS